MSDTQTSLDFDDLSSSFNEYASYCSVSEIHGVISGLITVGIDEGTDRLLSVIARHLEVDALGQQVADVLALMQNVIKGELEGTDFSYKLLLPDDDEELAPRVDALSQWCQGFLIGFGTGVKKTESNFSKDAQEVLKDLIDISNVDSRIDEEEREHRGEEDEAEEQAYTELQEYVRTAVMMLYTEFGVETQSSDKSQDPQVIH